MTLANHSIRTNLPAKIDLKSFRIRYYKTELFPGFTFKAFVVTLVTEKSLLQA
jgi:hypothetical protein